VKISQWFTITVGIGLVAVIYFFGEKTAPRSSSGNTGTGQLQEINADTILNHAKEGLSPEQVSRLGILEQAVTRGDVRSQQLNVFHQLAHFWKDSAGIFEPYAWYEAESARLEDSEKSLTFAGHLFLSNLMGERDPVMKKWKALQAKDLFERSLKINDKNDSSLVGLGACYLFGGIADNPMEGVLKVRQVADKDSTNVFAQLVLGQGSVITGQYDKAIDRFERVVRLDPDNLEAVMRLSEIYERQNDPQKAIFWYRKALPMVSNPVISEEIENRIKELNK